MGLIFDTIGYWFYITWSLMTPVITLGVIILLITGARLESLSSGETRLPSLVRKGLAWLGGFVPMAYLVTGWVIFLISALFWGAKAPEGVSFYSYTSNAAEEMSSVFGSIFAILSTIVGYDFALRVYIKINNLIRKVENFDKNK